MSGLSGLALQEKWDVPVIHMFHTLGLMKNRIARSEAEIEGEYRINGEFNVIRNANRIVAATIAERAQLESLYRAEAQRSALYHPVWTYPGSILLQKMKPKPSSVFRPKTG